ncbi:MAG: hypothetical protein B7733_13250 [Myxococcales bacterium FL481]|nr:MAG: hypothetical protein B7733_13250 [Myxococcales bacterium FL481]
MSPSLGPPLVEIGRAAAQRSSESRSERWLLLDDVAAAADSRVEIVRFASQPSAGAWSGTADRLPFADWSFDGAAMRAGYPQLVSLTQCLASLVRVVRIGGAIVVPRCLGGSGPRSGQAGWLRALGEAVLGWTPEAILLHHAALFGLRLATGEREDRDYLVFRRRDPGHVAIDGATPPRADPLKLRCIHCGATYRYRQRELRCRECGHRPNGPTPLRTVGTLPPGRS